MRLLLLFLSQCFCITVLFASSLNLTSSEQSYLKEKKILKVQNLNDFAPFNFNENNIPMGYAVDYLNLIANTLNIKIEYISGKSWTEYMEMLQNNQIDIIPFIAHNTQREKYIAFTDFNHVEYTTAIAVKKDLSINSVTDLVDKTIAVTKNTFLHRFLTKNFPKQKLLLTKTTSEALEALSNSKADAVIGSLPSLNYYIQRNWFSNLKTAIIDDLGLPEHTQLPMGVAKNNLLLKSVLEKANSTIPLNTIRDLKRKWMDVDLGIPNIHFNEDQKSYLQNKKEIKLCIDPDWMPYEKISDGKYIGISSDYMQYFEKMLDTKIRLVETKTWTETLVFAQSRKCDIISLANETNSRKEYFNFTKSYINVPLTIATTIHEPFINDMETVLANKSIGIVKGYSYAEILKENYPLIQLKEIDNITEGLKQVKSGKLFGFIGTLSALGYQIQNNYIGQLKIAGKFDETVNFKIAVRNDEPLLTNIFNSVIDTISKKQSEDILHKWVNVQYQKKVEYTLLWQITVVFALILLVILYKNRTVNKLNEKILEAKKEIEEQQMMVDKYVLMLTTDLKGYITNINQAYCNAIGYSKDEAIGKNHNILKHPEMKKSIFEKMWKTIKNDKIWQGQVTNLTKENNTIICNMYVEPIFKNGEKTGYRAICEDITDKKRIEELSIRDKLTSLYNRLKLDEIMIEKVEGFKRYKNDFSIILIDIDDFKIVNDTYGHDVGDDVLRVLSATLQSHVRLTDVVGRWGGEEFLIICENTNLENAHTLAEHIRTMVSNITFKEVGSKTISLGVAQYQENDTIASMFKRTDEALYKAKSSGKNCVVTAE
ncbi:MAG: transporter substrate-binding domain-containing protein [Arcobacteraceae bacterium]